MGIAALREGFGAVSGARYPATTGQAERVIGMATLEVLNIHTHATLQMAAPTSGDRHFVQVVLDEIESAGAHFPILFCKNAETGDFYAGAMLGLKPGENLVRDEPDGEPASRLHDVVREGFYIAEDAIAIDPEHSRFAVGGGSPVFETDGDATPALRSVQRALGQLHAGVTRTNAFIARLLSLKLVEPIDLSFSFDDGERLSVEGLYTISRDALAELDDGVVLELFRSGDLERIHSVIASLQHIRRLARLRNDRVATG
jgi:hypothetical protein